MVTMTLEQIQTKFSRQERLDEAVEVVFDGRIVGIMRPSNEITDIEIEELPDDVLVWLDALPSMIAFKKTLSSLSASWKL